MALFMTEKGDFKLLLYSDAKLPQNEQAHKDIDKIVKDFDSFLHRATVWVQVHCDLRWGEDSSSGDPANQRKYFRKLLWWYGTEKKGGVGPETLEELLWGVRDYYTKGDGRDFSAAFPKPKRPNYDPRAEVQSIYYQQHCLLEWCVRIAYAREYLDELLPTGAGASWPWGKLINWPRTLSCYMSDVVQEVEEEEEVH